MTEQKKRSAGNSGISLTLAALLSMGALQLVSCVAPVRGIPMTRNVEQNDIPVPGPYQFLGSETPDYGFVEGGAFRSWTGRYRGGGRIEDLVPWYIEQMNALGWSFARLEGVKDEKQLYFRKESEAAEIEIARRFSPELKAFANFVRAEIHPLGTEDYTVQANMERFGTIQTTSYTAGSTGTIQALEAEPVRAEATFEANRGSLDRQRALREIEAIEEIERP